jgi:hypothetical protein
VGVGRLIPGILLCAALAVAEPPAWRIDSCRHVHRTSGVAASLLVAEHPRGVTAVVQVCNATSAPVRVSRRRLPGGGPLLDWDGEARPAYQGGAEAGGEGPSLAPGETLAFDVELTDLYALRDGEFYQAAYATETSAGLARTGVEGFYLRLTD